MSNCPGVELSAVSSCLEILLWSKVVSKVVGVEVVVSAKLFTAKIVIYQGLSRYGQNLAGTSCKMGLVKYFERKFEVKKI